MDQKTLEKKIQKLRNLENFKNWTDEQLEEYVLSKSKDTKSPDPEIDVAGFFGDAKEKSKAVELYNRYSDDYEIETISDKNTLVNLVYLEVLNGRFQKLLNDAHTADAKTINNSLIENLHSNIDKIAVMKDKLGISKKKLEESSTDALKTLHKKYKLWLSKNQGSRTLSCPHCGKMTMLRIRMEHWDAQKHPYYEDRLVYNKKLFAEYDKWKRTGQPVVVDATFVAEVLDVSPDYIEDVIARRKRRDEIKDVKTNN